MCSAPSWTNNRMIVYRPAGAARRSHRRRQVVCARSLLWRSPNLRLGPGGRSPKATVGACHPLSGGSSNQSSRPTASGRVPTELCPGPAAGSRRLRRPAGPRPRAGWMASSLGSCGRRGTRTHRAPRAAPWHTRDGPRAGRAAPSGRVHRSRWCSRQCRACDRPRPAA
jgi:hypothetical protein